MWLCQMRVVRKAERSTCLELDECQNSILPLSQERTHVRGHTRRSLSFKTGFPLSFISTFLHPLFLPNQVEFPSMGPRCEFCVTTSALSRAQQTGHGGPKPCGTQIWLGIQDRSAPHWIWGCNSPSVCGLGWCGGRGEMQVSHGKACFIVCHGE